jgi:hypothetical protein
LGETLATEALFAGAAAAFGAVFGGEDFLLEAVGFVSKLDMDAGFCVAALPAAAGLLATFKDTGFWTTTFLRTVFPFVDCACFAGVSGGLPTEELDVFLGVAAACGELLFVFTTDFVDGVATLLL